MNRLKYTAIKAGTTKGKMLLMVCNEKEANHIDLALPRAWQKRQKVTPIITMKC